MYLKVTTTNLGRHENKIFGEKMNISQNISTYFEFLVTYFRSDAYRLPIINMLWLEKHANCDYNLYDVRL